MRLVRFRHLGSVHAGVLTPEGVVPVPEINARRRTKVPDCLLGIIESGDTAPLADTRGCRAIPLEETVPILPYDVPPKIWCIGLNYKSHAVDIDAVQPDEPGSFMKPASCMMEPDTTIFLPPHRITREVDAEGELGVIIGRACKYIPSCQAPEVIFGYTTTLDLTALDVLRKNPRYLTRAKSFDTFFSFGPVIVTADEVADVDQLEVITEHNGEICSRDFVYNMHTRPFDLVAFHSEYMTLYPGDLISTGCPKGARIKAGDEVRARIDGVGTLSAGVLQGLDFTVVG
jgi:2-keto-4-pentenoate hydratase/2-oxohepta-3-ene-1,7-dioic acid hydratase in catechol pathway